LGSERQVKKGAQVAKISNPRAAVAAENIKVKSFFNDSEVQRVDLGLPTAIDPVARKEATAKARTEESVNVKQRLTNVIIISTETSNGRSDERKIKEEEDRRRTNLYFIAHRS
ncbi:hypothetical protein Dimus_035442, partial [Dionaea muscipula]